MVYIRAAAHENDKKMEKTKCTLTGGDEVNAKEHFPAYHDADDYAVPEPPLPWHIGEEKEEPSASCSNLRCPHCAFAFNSHEGYMSFLRDNAAQSCTPLPS